jgi:cytochrome c
MRSVSPLFTLLLVTTPIVAAAEGDAVAGKAIFVLCAACHAVEAGATSPLGPNLHGVFGKKAGTNANGFEYSDALKASGIVWDETTMDTWIKNPAGVVPGTKMEYVGLTKKDKRENVIAYLKSATQ